MSINPILNIETITKDDENLFSLSGVRAITLYGTFFYHRDHQGSIIALTDEYGDVVERIEYDEHYGHIIKHTKESEVETLNPYGYTGREIETEELYYYRARYYDAQTQRFISVDPIGFISGDFNFYRYVGNRPLNFTDPSGLCVPSSAPAHEKIAFGVCADPFKAIKSFFSYPKVRTQTIGENPRLKAAGVPSAMSGGEGMMNSTRQEVGSFSTSVYQLEDKKIGVLLFNNMSPKSAFYHIVPDVGGEFHYLKQWFYFEEDY